MDDIITVSFTGIVDDPALSAPQSIYGYATFDPNEPRDRVDPVSDEGIFEFEDPDAVFLLGDDPYDVTSYTLRVGNNIDINGAGFLILDTLIFEARSADPSDSFILEVGVGTGARDTIIGRNIPEAPITFDEFDGSFGTRIFDPDLGQGFLSAETTRFFLSEGRIGDGIGQDEAELVAFLYEAGLNRNGAIDPPGLNFWIDQREGGASFRQIAIAFTEATEFREIFGAPDELTDEGYVEQLYRNVLDREGEEAGVVFWTGELAEGRLDRADVLLAFARSIENTDVPSEIERLVEVAPGLWDFLEV